MTPTPFALMLLNARRLSQAERNAVIAKATEIAEAKGHGMVDRWDVADALLELGFAVEREGRVYA